MEKAIKKYFPIFLLPTMIAFAIGFIVPFVYGIFLSFVSSQPLQTGNGKGYRIIRESFCKRKVRHNIYSFIMVYSVIYGCIGADHQCDFISHCDGTYQRHQGYQSFPYRIFPAQPDWWYRTQLYLVNDF